MCIARENTSNTVPHNCFEPIGHTVVNNNVGNCETSQNVQSNEPQSGKQPPGEQSKQFAAFIPPGGTIASAFNIAATTLGAGIFGLPSSAGSSGLIMGMFYLFFISCMTIYSMRNLALAADRSKAPTYESVTFVLMGRRVAYAIAVLRALDGFTSCVAYVISVGDILSAILKGTNAPDFLKEKSGNRLLMAVVWACFMLPLTIPRHIDSLRYVSTFAVTFMVYFVIVIVVHSCMNGLSENIKNVSVGKSDTAAIILFNSGFQAIEGMGVFMFSYTCQDTAYEVYIDMKDRSVRKFVIAAIIAMSLCTALYIITAFFGYMDFGRAVSGSILLMYDPVKEPAVMVGMIGVLVKLVASYALLAMACRNALYDVVGKTADSLPFWKHCVSVIVLSTAALLLGLFIPNVNTVLGFSGSITGGSLGFVFPALLIMYSGGFTWQKVGSLHYLATYVLLICGVVGIVFGTGASIWGTITG
ncbi:amino acid transporter, putative [Trypanosoma brucei gambiense DAL972]|uniref:Amino acid transporter, putative n=1 Tax=Trypanosoma brucei gambiense (strain MHOM/CI/86/DAL972) TaxID=679716 RepID=C9ZN60_TRYB9|nr:amino acid transporter, putative [Trypanosoma brucei gambiense DAL972]CBH10714.1 amino acid transporter, putative [Trypanosoma brucei gambiense DAL972]|eukprot:XP_011773002.1 amino acid transporter, putative [Trypanosoma brucei gambiense DAL972]